MDEIQKFLSIATNLILEKEKAKERMRHWDRIQMDALKWFGADHRLHKIPYAICDNYREIIEMIEMIEKELGVYRVTYKPMAAIKGQRLALQDYEGIYRLDNGSYLEAHEWIAQEWDGEGIEPIGWVYYTIYSASDDTEEIDGGVMGYDHDTTLNDFSEFLASAGQGQIISRIGTA